MAGPPRGRNNEELLRALRWGAFVSWLIVAGLAVGGFAAFSPKPAAETSSTTRPANVADGRGESTARILASAFANAAADRTFITAGNSTTTRATITIEADSTIPDVTTPAPSTIPAVPAPEDVSTGGLAWESGSECEASWYGPGFDGRRTANGEVYDMYALTAAHPTLPLAAPPSL